MKQIDRVVLIVLDSVGIGEAPDAALYNDVGSDTLGNIARNVPDFCLPNMNKFGLHLLNEPYRTRCPVVPREKDIIASYGILTEKSVGKDTTTGHWELCGIITEKPFPVYPEGFPAEIMKEFVARTGVDYLGNTVASGTEVIEQYGSEHMQTGKPIIYTSADSVFQIAAHEGVVPLETLYDYCRIARKILQGEHAVSRVIARPFLGELGHLTRTVNRRDYSLNPPGDTILDIAFRAGEAVTGIGKISDIFNGNGISESIKTSGNLDGIQKTIDCILRREKGIIFTNLIDFDMLFGHRNNPVGYANALIEFDQQLMNIVSALSDQDILIITADHGCDPTTTSTDHTRELVPLIVYCKNIHPGINIGIRDSFADVAASIAEILRLEYSGPGNSFLQIIMGTKEE